MSNYAELGDLVEQIREASTNIRTTDEKNGRRLEAIEALVNELYRKTSRPGAVGGSGFDDDVVERESAIGMCEIRRALTVPKVDGVQTTEYAPTQSEIDAGCASRAFTAMLRNGDVGRLDYNERKSLSAFSFGNNGFLLPPGRSNIVLSCLVVPTDLSGKGGICDTRS